MHERLTKWWNGVSLRTKITGVTVLLLSLGLLVAGLGTMSSLRYYLVQEVDAKISSVVIPLTHTITYRTSGDKPSCTITQVPTEYYLAVVSSDGELVCDNKKVGDDRPSADGLTLAKVQDHDGAFTLHDEGGTGQWRAIAYLPANVQATVLVGLNLDDANGLIANYSATFIFFALTVVILGGALTRLLVTSTFGPLREVEDTAARFAAGDFSQRLDGGPANTEVGRLNGSLNTMLIQIDSAFSDRAKTIDQMRRFVGDASHELRTPLVSVRGYAELYRMGALPNPEDVAQAMGRIEKEAIRMGTLVEDLLELARIDEAKPLNLAPVDLIPLASDAALDAMASSPGRRVRVLLAERVESVEEPDDDPRLPMRAPAQATGPIGFAGATIARLRTRRPRAGKDPDVDVDRDPDRAPSFEFGGIPSRVMVLAEENKVRQIITNLMGNALRFTSAESPIEIAITADEAEDSAVIDIIDHGEGIPPQIREKIFQRFWRADSSRNRDTGGSGLGLAIVASLVVSHRGTVDVVETPGGGSTFRVRLPLLHEESAASGVPS